MEKGLRNTRQAFHGSPPSDYIMPMSGNGPRVQTAVFGFSRNHIPAYTPYSYPVCIHSRCILLARTACGSGPR